MTEHFPITVNSISALAEHGIDRFCMAVGIFDGVHGGHRHLLRRLSDMAEKLHAAPVVLTFFPHPKVIVDPDHAPTLLLSAEEKAARLASCGVKAELKGKLLPVGMMIALDYVWDNIKADRTKKKAIMIDEIWPTIKITLRSFFPHTKNAGGTAFNTDATF